MLRWISMLGGLLLMMGRHDRSEALFYYLRLEDQVLEDHLLRLMEKHISFTYQPGSNSYLCPAGQPLNYGGRSARNRTHLDRNSQSGACSQRPQCTSAAFRCLA